MSQVTFYNNNNATLLRIVSAAYTTFDSIWVPRHQTAAKYWSIAVTSVIGLVVVSHWTTFVFSKTSGGRQLLKPVLSLTRRFNSVRLNEHAPTPSQVVLVVLYCGITMIMALYDRPYDSGLITSFAQRMGW